MTLNKTKQWRVVEEHGYKFRFRVVDENGDIAIGKYGYKGRLGPVRYATAEAAERAIDERLRR
jgi:hypothetical protein